MQHDIRFFAVVRDKATITEKVLEHNKSNPQYRYHPNQLYDRCVSRLFKSDCTKKTATSFSSLVAAIAKELKHCRMLSKRHDRICDHPGASRQPRPLKSWRPIRLTRAAYKR